MKTNLQRNFLILGIIFGLFTDGRAQYLNTDGTNHMTATLYFQVPNNYAAIELGSNIGGFIDFKTDVNNDFDGRIIYNLNNSGRFDIYGTTNFKDNVSVVGLMGVGTTTPDAALHVAKAKPMADGSLAAARLGTAYNHWTYFGAGNSGRIRGSAEGYLFVESNAKGSGNKRLYLNYSSPGDVTIAAGGGNVIIGQVTQSNSSYKLDVYGKIRANEIVVNTTGADFVFEPNYNLPNLEFVEQYIKENRHLPEIPSADSMQKEGMAVGELNTKLLQKIEELTLYLIEQNEINKAQALEIDALKQKVNALMKESSVGRSSR